MTIELLTMLKDNPNLGYFPDKGLSVQKIELLEKEFNKGEPFPKAIREFLFLAGESNHCGFEVDPDMETVQIKAKAEMGKLNQQIDRPIFVFDSHNDFESFLFVFLDENTDDPKTFVYQGHFLHLGDELFEHNGFTFKSLVEEHINRILKNY